VPYSVCGDLPPDQYFLQHGTMFQHENKVAGWRLLQKRKTGDVVREDEDDSYNIYSYCRDVTVGLMEYTRTPWSMEKMMSADAEEKKVRQKFGKKVGTDAAREEKGSFAKYVKQVIVVNQAEVPEFKKEENRLALEGHLEEQGKEYDTGVRFFYLKGEDDLIKKLKDATWASGCILNPGPHHASEKLRDAIKELKFKVVEVHTAAVDAAADKVKDAAAQRMNKGIFGYGEALEWLKGQMG
jgi:3-dehydroquinate dehydratase